MSAASNVSCPHCHGLIAADPSLAGQQVACPHCSGQLLMPGAGLVQVARAVQEVGNTTDGTQHETVDYPVSGTDVVIRVERHLLERLQFQSFSVVWEGLQTKLSSTVKNVGSSVFHADMLTTVFRGVRGEKLNGLFYFDASLRSGEVTYIESSCDPRFWGLDAITVGGLVTGIGQLLWLVLFWITASRIGIFMATPIFVPLFVLTLVPVYRPDWLFVKTLGIRPELFIDSKKLAAIHITLTRDAE